MKAEVCHKTCVAKKNAKGNACVLSVQQETDDGHKGKYVCRGATGAAAPTHTLQDKSGLVPIQPVNDLQEVESRLKLTAALVTPHVRRAAHRLQTFSTLEIFTFM